MKRKVSTKYFLVVLSLIAGLLSPAVAVGQDGSAGTGMEYRKAEASVAAGLFSSNSFVDWYRYPAEERRWLRQTGATAYTRDVLAGGETFISGAADGETWHADAQRPDGSTITWGQIRFYSSYSGLNNCFVSPFWYICNASSLYVLWYSNAQCQEAGSWTMNFYNNGNRFYTGQYKLLPQIPPGKVPLYNQGAYTDAYDSICRTGTQRNVYACDGRPDEVAWTIRAKGCAMTSEAMVLGYHGVTVDPATLNTWMINNSGYDSRGNVYWDVVARYGRAQGTQMSYLGATGDLDDSVCTYGPQIISVRNRGHWVTATGQNEAETTRLINDPNGGVATTLAARYGNNFGQIRRFGGPEFTYTDITGIVIRFHSPGELVVADPLGRLTGFDPVSGQSFSEIPGSFYTTISLEDDETGTPGPETHELDIRQPIAGDYEIEVVGTGTGTYDLEINAYDPDGTPSQAVFTEIPVFPGAVHSYAFNYSKTVGDPIEPAGGFDGGGQRPRDVNKFLSYGNPGESRTRLPADTTTYSLLVFYGETILPNTFSAILNRTDVSAWFSPSPGEAEIVEIPLDPGQNVLKLSVDGQIPNRVATDSDRLVFLVP